MDYSPLVGQRPAAPAMVAKASSPRTHLARLPVPTLGLSVFRPLEVDRTLSEDITERKQTEEKLHRSEADFLEAQRLSHTGSWRHDLLSGTLTVSPEVLRMYGLQSDDCLSTIEALYGGIHPDDRSVVRQAYESAQAQKADFVADYRIVLRDGTIKYLHTLGHPVLNQSGEVVE
jgi:PAS domain-containing protein